MNIFEKSRRPAERVELFLEDYAGSERCDERLPDAETIAAQVGVSRSTVRNVLSAWRLQGRLTSRRGKGVYLLSPGRTERRERTTIASNLRNIDTGEGPWGERIRLGAMDATAALGPDWLFSSLYSAEEEIAQLPSAEILRRCENVDGFILYQRDPHLALFYQHCRDRGKPYVLINQPDEECSMNFVTTGNFRAFSRLGEAMCQTGRRRFALLIYPSAASSAPIRQRLAGLACGIGDALGNGVDLRIVPCDGWQEEHGYRATQALLAERSALPDVFLCAGDWLAIGAVKALEAAGVRLPEEASVVAGAGFTPDLATEKISALVHPVDRIGRELVDLLTTLLKKRETEIPGRTLPVGFQAGRTTRLEETKLLLDLF